MGDKEELIFLILGPICGYTNPLGLPRHSCQWFKHTPWTSRISEATVRRFVDEAKYFLEIHNVVVQHFLDRVPSENHPEEGSDSASIEERRDSMHNSLWGSQSLDDLLSPEVAAEPEVCEEGVNEAIETEVENSHNSLQRTIASTSSTTDRSNIMECPSLIALVQTLALPHKSSLFKCMKDRFWKGMNEEMAALKKRVTHAFPGFAERNKNKLNKLVRKTHDYSILLDEIETEMKTLSWPAYDGRVVSYIDFRQDTEEKSVYHIIYAPSFLIAMLETVYIKAYCLFEKTYTLEKKMQVLDSDEFARLQESKQKIVFPTVEEGFPSVSEGAAASE